MARRKVKESDPVEDGRLADVDGMDDPLWVRLLWDPDEEAWITSTNAAGEDPKVVVATALSSVLYRMAIGELRERD